MIHPISKNMECMFYRCLSLLSLDLNNFNTSNVETTKGMFWECSSLVYLNLNSFNTSNINDMSVMFCECKSLTILNLENFNTSKVKNMGSMFSRCISLISINLNYTNFNTSNVNNMGFMFYNCFSLIPIDINSFDTSSVSNMDSMFYNNSKLQSITLNHFNTSNLTIISNIFSRCSSLNSINLTNFDMSNVFDISGMFYGCSSLKSLDLSKLNTANVKNMYGMFFECSSLTSLDLYNFNTSNVKSMNYMFYNCKNLTYLNINSFNTSNVEEMISMFSGCSSLTSLDLYNFNTSNVKTMSKMFSECSSLTSLDLYNFNTSNVKSMDSMFYNCNNLTYLNINNFNTSNVEEMMNLFYGCSSLISLDLYNFNTSNAKYMNSMFYNCNVLEYLNINNFKTSNVVDMSHIFSYCSSLTSLNLYNFNTSNVKIMDNMFFHCKNLTFLNINSFDTSNANSMANMFCECSSLTSLNLTNFNTGNVTNMYSMFLGCSSLSKIELNSFNTSKVDNMGSMFDNCKSLISLDLHTFNTSEVKSMSYMFNSCISLTSLYLNNFITKNVIKMDLMFNNCTSLITLDLHNFDTQSVTIMYYMFNNCESLISLNIDNFDLSHASMIHLMFHGCHSLISLKLDNLNSSSKIATYMFEGCNTNLIYCIDYSKNYSFLPQLSGFKNNNCSDICFTDSNHKLIREKRKCIDKCENDDIYIFEYNNICYDICPNDTFLIYSKKECIDYIPEGYYLKDFINKTVEKCNIKCKNCSYESMLNNSCIFCNEDDYYYPVYNQNNSFVNCLNNDTSDGFYLDNNIYKECYPTCKRCYDYGNKNDHKCIQCKYNYTLINNNCYESCKYYYYFNSTNNYECTSTKNCPYNYSKLIKEKNQCIDNCTKDEKYKYEFYSTCYEFPIEQEKNITSTFMNPIEKEINESNISIDLSYLYIYSDIQNEKEINNNSNYEFNVLDIIYNITNISNNNYDEKDKMMLRIKGAYINGKLDAYILDLIEGEKKDILISDNNIIYQFTSTYNQNNDDNKNISKIKLGECEKKLKQNYEINENETLLIFKTNIFMEGYLIPIIEYEIYDSKTRKQLDLNICKNMNIIILHSVDIDENNLFKKDPLNDYYNDICYTYTTENKTDIILKDRQNEYIENNLSLCESNCEYEGYDNKKKNVKCNCLIKIKLPLISEIVINKDKFLNNFVEIKNYINLNVMKCYSLLFTKEGLLKNIGNYIILSIILINIILLIIFIFKGYRLLYNKIDSLIQIKNETNNIDIIEEIKNQINKIEITKKNPHKIEYIVNNGTINLVIRNEYSINLNNIKENDKNEKINNNPPKLNKNNSFVKQIKNEEEIGKSSSGLINKNNEILLKKEKSKYSINQNITENINNLKYYNDYELNNLSYKEALKIDKRTYSQYYLSLLKLRHLLIFTFYTYDDYNSKIIKICLFFFLFALYFIVNALFFSDSTIHKIYTDQGNFNLIYQIPQILYSSIISNFIDFIITYLSLTGKQILEIKKEKGNVKEKSIKIKTCIICKFVFFFQLVFLLLLLFWYYISCLCAVYKNTQIHLIKDTLISFTLSLLYPLGICLLPGLFRIPSLRAENRNKEYLYKFSIFIQLI